MMWGFDPHVDEQGCFPEGISFTEGLRRWLAGQLRQPTLAAGPTEPEVT